MVMRGSGKSESEEGLDESPEYFVPDVRRREG